MDHFEDWYTELFEIQRNLREFLYENIGLYKQFRREYLSIGVGDQLSTIPLKI